MTHAPMSWHACRPARLAWLALWCAAGLRSGVCQQLAAGQHPPSPAGRRYALIITGLSGDKAHYKKFWTAASHLVSSLTEAYGYDREDVWLLFEEADESKALVLAQSTLENIVKAFDDLKRRLTPRDTLLLVLIGHTDYVGRRAKFNIKGRDLTDVQLGKLLNTLPACRMCVAVTTTNSGYFLRHLSRKGRVVITATKVAREVNETVFPYCFAQAFSDREADADKDARLTAAEIFAYAKANVKKFYKEQGLMQTEHALLDDNGDGLGSLKLDKDGRDGKLAREFAFEVTLDL